MAVVVYQIHHQVVQVSVLLHVQYLLQHHLLVVLYI
jgi:hypothetical protein